MPEITSVERVREKLGQFETLAADAITAVKTLTRLRSEAAGLLDQINARSARSAEMLVAVEDQCGRLGECGAEWADLKKKVEEAIANLGSEVAAAEARLKVETSVALQSCLDSARQIEDARKEVAGVQNDMMHLLATARSDLTDAITAKLREVEDRLTRRIGQQMKVMSSELDIKLNTQSEALERRITDFLIKQNALIQNLTQHVEGYERVSQTIAREFLECKDKIALIELQATTAESGVRQAKMEIAALMDKLGQLPLIGRQFRT